MQHLQGWVEQGGVRIAGAGAPGAGSVSIGGVVGGGVAGSVLFVDANGNLAQDNQSFFWDNTNNFLGLRTNTPSNILDIVGPSGITIRSTATGQPDLGISIFNLGKTNADPVLESFNIGFGFNGNLNVVALTTLTSAPPAVSRDIQIGIGNYPAIYINGSNGGVTIGSTENPSGFAFYIPSTQIMGVANSSAIFFKNTSNVQDASLSEDNTNLFNIRGNAGGVVVWAAGVRQAVFGTATPTTGGPFPNNVWLPGGVNILMGDWLVNNPGLGGLYVTRNGQAGCCFDAISSIGPARVWLRGARGTQAALVDSTSGDTVGQLAGNAYSSGYQTITAINHVVDGTFTTGQAPPGRMEFYTRAVGAGLNLRMTMNSTGAVTLTGLLATPSITAATTNITLNAIGTGTIGIGNVSTGNVNLVGAGGFVTVGGTGATGGRLDVTALDNVATTNVGIFWQLSRANGVGIGFQEVRQVGTNAGINLNANGSGVIQVGNSSTGNVLIGNATAGGVRVLSNSLGFYGAAAATKQTVTGAKGGNAALGSLMAALVALGLFTDTTTA